MSALGQKRTLPAPLSVSQQRNKLLEYIEIGILGSPTQAVDLL
jgi:hypothetical protein